MKDSFDTNLPIGFSITTEELGEKISNYITANAVAGWSSLGAVISALKNTAELRWANPLEVKNAVEKTFTKTFGAKEAAKPKGKVCAEIDSIP